MKLKNKLLSLTSLVAATGLVVPMTTSCGKNTSMVDITSPYVPTIAKAEPLGTRDNPATVEKGYNLYMNHVMANPDILRQDIWYYEAQKLPSRIQQIEYMYADGSTSAEKTCSVSNVVANVLINNVEVKKQTVIIESEQTEFYTISLDIGYEYKYTAISLSTEPRYQVNRSFNFNAKYNDIPVYMYTDVYRDWYVSMNLLDENIDAYLSQLPGWYVDYSISESDEYVVTTNGMTQITTNESSNSDKITRRSQIYDLKEDSSSLYGTVADSYLNFSSYHMQNVWAPKSFVSFKDEIDLTASPSDDGEIAKKGLGNLNIFDLTDEAKALTDIAENVYVDIDDGSGTVQSDPYIYINSMSSTTTDKTLYGVAFGMNSSSTPATVSKSDIYLDYLTGTVYDTISEDEKFIATIPANSYWATITWEDENGNILRQETFPMTEKISLTITVGPQKFATIEWEEFVKITDEYYDSIKSGTKTKEEALADLLEAFEITKLEDVLGVDRTVIINGQKHIVKCVGINHDELITPSGQQTKALFTFQACNKLSDEDGKGYNCNNNAPDHTAGALYKNLNGEDNKAVWYYPGDDNNPISENRTLKQMLYDTNTGTPVLNGKLKEVRKQVAVWDDDNQEFKLKDNGYTATIFAHTPNELGVQSRIQSMLRSKYSAYTESIQEIPAGETYELYKTTSYNTDIYDVSGTQSIAYLFNTPSTIKGTGGWDNHTPDYIDHWPYSWQGTWGDNASPRGVIFGFCI